MRNAFSDALVAAAVADPRVLLLTGDHGYALFDQFRKKCPHQYINCGVAEQNMVGVAAGLAKAGFRPVVYGLAAFVPIRVLEQIKIDICYENLPVILIGDGAGLVYSHLGTSHQSTEDIACTRSVPELMILSPADRFEMTAAMQLAFRSDSPVYLRMGKSDCGDIHSAPFKLQPGELLQVRHGTSSIAILATGSMVKLATKLADQNQEIEVWSVPVIKPLSEWQLGEISKRATRLITLEEHSVIGGVGSTVAEMLSLNKSVSICRIGIENKFSYSCGNWEHMLNEHGLDINSIYKKIQAFIERD
jgi:transketolase